MKTVQDPFLEQLNSLYYFVRLPLRKLAKKCLSCAYFELQTEINLLKSTDCIKNLKAIYDLDE